MCSGRVRVSGLSTQLHDSHLRQACVLEQKIAELPPLHLLSLTICKSQHTRTQGDCGVSQLIKTLEGHEQSYIL